MFSISDIIITDKGIEFSLLLNFKAKKINALFLTYIQTMHHHIPKDIMDILKFHLKMLIPILLLK